MRMSCNGCRVLRKGCSENCSIRPCLEWIKSPESQANATVFLAKFYGRAGLMNLINAGPSHLRPAIFRSLLYEACGRIVNPIYGSVGLLWSGSWQLCQNAVEAVLKGDPITQITSESAETKQGPPLKACDIRHVNKDENISGSGDLSRVRTRPRFKRTRKTRVVVGSDESGHRSPSHESSLSHQSEAVEPIVESGSLDSEETEEMVHLTGSDPGMGERVADNGEIELDLTLGFEPFKKCVKPKELAGMESSGSADEEAGLFRMELGLC